MISLSAIVITLSIVLSMIQQINYIIAWKAIKDAAHQLAKDGPTNPSYAFVTTYNEFDTILFLIRKCGIPLSHLAAITLVPYRFLLL